jgi:hypothetical protein
MNREKRRREAALSQEEVAAILAVVEARVAEEAGASEGPPAAPDAWAAAGRPGPARGHHRRRPGDPAP